MNRDLRNTLIQASRMLAEKKCVSLEKQCKQEYIVIKFVAHPKGDIVMYMQKEHYDLERKVLRKTKNTPFDLKSIADVVDDAIYDLVLRGYEIAE